MKKYPSAKQMSGALQAGYAVSSASDVDTYRAAACRLYKFTADHNYPENYDMVEYGAFVDVYEGLEVFANDKTAHDAIGIGLVTTGWAAPLPADYDGENDENVSAPSEHPERRRVILHIVKTLDGDAFSVIDIQGHDEVQEDSTGRGPLADALEYALTTASKVTA